MSLNKDKAILLISFGTTYKETRELTINSIEEHIRNSFRDYEVRRAFTSHKVIEILKHRDNLHVDTPEEALNRLTEEGYSEIIVQSLHIIPGEEYEYVENVVKTFSERSAFERIVIGRPMLFFKGDDEDIPDDYTAAVMALKSQLPKHGAAVFMGHGTPHPSNACYPCLQQVFRDHGMKDVYIATVEGYPTLENVIASLKRDSVNQVTLMPFMIVAGDHCINDMASDEEDSWKSVLKKEGFQVEVFAHGIGENPEVKDIFARHVEDAMFDRYKNIGKTKKGR